MAIRDSLETIVRRTLTTVQINVVPECYYTGLILGTGAVIDDYTGWGLLPSIAFAGATRLLIKGIQEGYNRFLPGMDIQNSSRDEALASYGLVTGTCAAAITTATLTTMYATQKLGMGAPIEDVQSFIYTGAKLTYLELLSYGMFEVGNFIYRPIREFFNSGSRTMRNIIRTTSAGALVLGLAASTDMINPASYDFITPFERDGVSSQTIDATKLPPDMKLEHDIFGSYATIHLQPGESIYGAVVLKHTDVLEHEDVMKASEEILRRSFGIRSLWKGYDEISSNDELKIPADLLSERYSSGFNKPARSKKPIVKPTGDGTLSGVHIILDSGHGEIYPGAVSHGIVEDEVTYDIVSRVGQLLENNGAQVYYLVEDLQDGHKPKPTLRTDKNEQLSTTPSYTITNSKVSANMRIYLTNSIYHGLIEQGVSPDAIAFTSIHVDALSPQSRGLMVYYPEASLRNSSLKKSGSPYTQFSEFTGDPVIEIEATKEQSEAQSYSLANLVVTSAESQHLPIGINPVRGSIHRGRQTYVPAVLRWNPVEQKILIEVGNCANSADAKALNSPEHREEIAKAITAAYIAYYKGNNKVR